MNSEDPDKLVGELLRSRAPEVETPPGLEGRILRAIGGEKHRSAPVRWWRWLLLPPAAALLAVLLWPEPGSLPPAEDLAAHDTDPPDQASPPEARENDPAVAIVEDANPLAWESAALRRDAGRAGKFLLESMPSLSSATRR